MGNTETTENKQDQEWVWCLVGNIVDSHPVGQEHVIKSGTRRFSAGTKVYIAPQPWGDGGKVLVIGKSRGSMRYIETVVDTDWITDWRKQKVFSPQILSKMKRSEHRWWNEIDDAEYYIDKSVEYHKS